MNDKIPERYDEVAGGFKQFIEWKEKEGEGYPVPARGMHPSYDDANDKVKEIEQEFDDHLQEVKMIIGSEAIDYVHSKYRYEIEVMESKVSKVPD